MLWIIDKFYKLFVQLYFDADMVFTEKSVKIQLVNWPQILYYFSSIFVI